MLMLFDFVVLLHITVVSLKLSKDNKTLAENKVRKSVPSEV